MIDSLPVCVAGIETAEVQPSDVLLEHLKPRGATTAMNYRDAAQIKQSVIG
jgi:hypothetical protein